MSGANFVGVPQIEPHGTEGFAVIRQIDHPTSGTGSRPLSHDAAAVWHLVGVAMVSRCHRCSPALRSLGGVPDVKLRGQSGRKMRSAAG